MIKSIRHLRGNEADWAGNDIVVPDGEIAILHTGGGQIKLKVGDGVRRFSALPALIGNTLSLDQNDLTVEHGFTYRLGRRDALALRLPDAPDADFFTEISFQSASYATEFEATPNIIFTGDGTADGDFTPEAMRNYTLFIGYDGSYQGVVRGVPYA